MLKKIDQGAESDIYNCYNDQNMDHDYSFKIKTTIFLKPTKLRDIKIVKNPE